VVARTLEAGIRNTGESKLRWSAGWFRAENTNDIPFVASQQTGFGYFVNYGKTRRQGAEISLSSNYRWFTLGGNYTFHSDCSRRPDSADTVQSAESRPFLRPRQRE
jgi:outer membrane receptor protein involved in Fe transport